jgi:hypothetical protein
MRVEDLEAGLRRLLEVKSGSAEPTLRERVEMKSSDEWDADEWEFANQRGLIPPGKQVEYQRRVVELRHQAELDALTGGEVAANFGGNVPGLGTATVPNPAPMGSGLGTTTVSGQPVPEPRERLRTIELEEERLRAERDALLEQVEAEDAAEATAGDYSTWTVARLRGEVQSRNDGREVDDMIQPASNRKDDLLEALNEDDSRRSTKQPEA